MNKYYFTNRWWLDKFVEVEFKLTKFEELHSRYPCDEYREERERLNRLYCYISERILKQNN